MASRTLSRTVVILGSVCCFSFGLAQTKAERRPPNVVLLIADDLGYGELGCQGNAEIPTPHIDRLASTGVRCTQAYVTAPNCSPSRAGLFTGRTPTRFGYEFNPIGARNEDPGTGLPKSETTIAECLHAVGYSTALLGKWHLGGTADFHPQRRGFDEFFGFLHEGHYYVPSPWEGTTTMLRRRVLPGNEVRYRVSDALIYSSHMGHDEPAYDANNPILRGGQPVTESEYFTDALTREAISFVNRYRDAPFFLCVTYNAVHSPLQAKQETLKQFSGIQDVHRRIFAAMLSDLDQSVGKILDALATNQLREQTLILFLSDNGGPTRELTSSNAPLRDGKGSTYEGGLRVPFIVNWPGMLPGDAVSNEVISSLDIMPTLAQACGATLPRDVEGQDLLPLLTNPLAKAEPRTLYWRQGKRAALRQGPWKIVSPSMRAAERNWELYNMDSDIGETRDLAGELPQKLNELKRAWDALDAQMLAPRF